MLYLASETIVINGCHLDKKGTFLAVGPFLSNRGSVSRKYKNSRERSWLQVLYNQRVLITGFLLAF